MSAEVAAPVVIPYDKLLSHDVDLSQDIEEAFGYAGLGLLVVSGIPNFKAVRDACLPLGSKLAALGPDALAKIEHKSSNFSVGWSHGKERLKKGALDTYKGSFYANPQFDTPSDDPQLIAKYPQDYHPNLWPKEDLPELQKAFQDLGGLMVAVGAQIGRHCDAFIRKKIGDAYQPPNLLESIISKSRVAKGRLLHYFPVEESGDRARDSWCGWHNDHSCLTALCSSYYMEVADQTKEIACPDPDAGLYARTRLGKEMKISIPRDCLAFQIGESSQILTGGILRATPHAVQALRHPDSTHISRDTLAVFMQPNHDQKMEPPKGIAPENVAVGQWKSGQTYGEFSKVTIEFYYTDG